MVILYFGDIFAKPGRKAIAHALPMLKEKYSPDFIIGNVENLAGGRGVNKKTLQEMLDLGFDLFTSGNHIWDNREVYSILETEDRLLRPLNYPSPTQESCPGKGAGVFSSYQSKKLCVVNIMGRVFMDPMDCPFAAMESALTSLPQDIPIFVDFHADATSEKYAMAWFLSGRVSALVGSHSHVQTADERILPGGTAYITDVGMNGAFDSVIGLEPNCIIKKFITKRPQTLKPALENLGVSCVVISITEENKKATTIERLRFNVNIEKSDLLLDAQTE